MPRYEGLTVRHFDRHALDVPAELVIAPEHGEQVRLTTVSAGVSDPRTLKVTVRDISRGGLGMESAIFLPRMTKAAIRIWVQQPGCERRAVERMIRLRRASMCSEQPTYLLGAQFIARDGDDDSDLDDLLRLAEEHHGPKEDAA